MKRIVLSLVLILYATATNAYTPIIYINGQPHNAGVAYGITGLQDLMTHKSDDLAPGFAIISSSIFGRNDNDLDYGAQISALTYNQKLDGVIDGLFCQAIAPITIVSNKLDTRFVTHNTINDLDVLVQRAGVADITLLLGYTFLDTSAHQANVNINIIFPTEQRRCDNEQFLPSIGNGGHIALGASIDSTLRIVGNDKHNLTFAGEIDYHYLLESNKQHLIGLNRSTRAIINQALIGHATQMVPAYNATITNVTSLPGSALDVSASLTYNYHKFFFNVGCLYHFKNQTKLTHLDDTILNQTFDTFQIQGKTVDLENINPSKKSATIPESHLLNLDANIGFVCKEWIMPIFEIPYAYNLSAGGTVTVMHANEIGSWSLNIKSGVSF